MSELDRAMKKLKRFDKDRFCGRLTPAEIIALIKDGAIFSDYCSRKSDLERVRELKRKGESNPLHVSFFLRPHQIKKLT